MFKLSMIKSGLQLVTGIGVGLISDEALKKVTPKNLSKAKEVAIKVGGFVLSSMIIDKATDYVEEQFDDQVDKFKEFVRPKVKDITEETEAE